MAKTNIRTIRNYLWNILRFEIIYKNNTAYHNKIMPSVNHLFKINRQKGSSDLQLELQIIYEPENIHKIFLPFTTQIINQYFPLPKQFIDNGNIPAHNKPGELTKSYIIDITRSEAESLYTLFKLTNRVVEY